MATEISLAEIVEILPDGGLRLSGGITVGPNFWRRGGFSRPASPETTASEETDEVVLSPATEGVPAANMAQTPGRTLALRRDQAIPAIALDVGSEGPAA